MKKCFLCESPNLIFCNCQIPPVPLCLKCVPAHRTSLSHLASSPASQVKVPEPREVIEQFSTSRSRLCDAAVVVLKQRMEELESRVVREVTEMFETVFKQLEDMKTTAIDRAMLELNQYRGELESVIKGLDAIKFTENFQPTNTIQQLLLTTREEEFIATLRTFPLFSFTPQGGIQITCSGEAFYSLQWDEFGILNDFSKQCDWANQIVLIPESPSTLFDLVQQVKLPSGVNLSPPVGISMQSLPSGETFVCGGNLNTNGYVISSDYRAIENVCTLPSSRWNPGLCLFGNMIFILGGLLPPFWQPDQSISKYSIKSKTLKAMPVSMVEGRYGFCPCVFNNLIYIAGGFAPKIEVFDPLLVTIIPLSVYFEGDSHAVLVPYSEEILLCCNYIYSFQPRVGGDPRIVDDTYRSFCSPMMPLRGEAGVWMMIHDYESSKGQLVHLSDSGEFLSALSFPPVIFNPPQD